MVVATGGPGRPSPKGDGAARQSGITTSAAADDAAHRGTHARADDLIARAKAMLMQREQEAIQHQLTQETKTERIKAVLLTTLADTEDDDCEDNVEELKQAVDAAQKEGVLPELRVKARKFLAEHEAMTKKEERVERDVRRIMDQIKEAVKEDQESDELSPEEYDPRSAQREYREYLMRQHRIANLSQRLKLVLKEARAARAAPLLMEEATTFLAVIEKERKKEEREVSRLQGLLLEEDAEKLGEKLQEARAKGEGVSRAAQRVVNAIEERVMRLAMREQLELWLRNELEAAADREDPVRLQQLFDQARTLGLNIPPEMVSFQHELSARTYRSRKEPMLEQVALPAIAPFDEPSQELALALPHRNSKLGRARHRLKALSARKQEAAEEMIALAEDNPAMEDIYAARKALVVARQTLVDKRAVALMEKRMTMVELEHGRRLQAEESLAAFLRQEGRMSMSSRRTAAGDNIMLDDAKLKELSSILEDADFHEVDEALIDAGLDILERSMEVKKQKRDTEATLRNLLGRPAYSYTEADLDEIEEAIQDAKKLGFSTLHQSRELSRLRDNRVGVLSSEAELQEAAKGYGEAGRKRLEEAVQAAKRVGVSPQKLKEANIRLAELEKHEKRCELAAGSLRRVLPLLQTEPWHFEQQMKTVRTLTPYTPELQRAVRMAEEKMKKISESSKQREGISAELRSHLRHCQVEHVPGTGSTPVAPGAADGAVTGDIDALAKLLERARHAGVEGDLVQEADSRLKLLRREHSERDVAQQRLRLAMNAKDPGEIERSMRQVRALSHHDGKSGPKSAREKRYRKGDERELRTEQVHSARLMEAANTMLRQLSDAASRRQAAESALQERISDDGTFAIGALNLANTGGPKEKSREAQVEAWIQDVREAVVEAKQSGVTPTLISHANLKIRERKREAQEEAKACAALQKSLSRKGAPVQEVLRDLKRLQRISSQQGFE